MLMKTKEELRFLFSFYIIFNIGFKIILICFLRDKSIVKIVEFF